MTFWKKQNYGDSELSVAKGSGEGGRIFRAVKIFCMILLIENISHYTFLVCVPSLSHA